MEAIIKYLQSEWGVKLITVFIALIGVLLLSSILKKVIPKYISETSTRYRARKFINFFGYILVVFSILIVFSNKLTGLNVFIGVTGAAFVFALQEVVASMAGFVFIHTSNFYNVGDRVMVGGIKGDVIDIGVLRTSLMEIGAWVDGDLYNGRITRVANSFIFKEPVFNYSGNFPFLWDEVKIPIKQESDVAFARAHFLAILNEIQGKYAEEAEIYWDKMTEKLMVENAQVSPMISMSFDENWITFILRYVVDYKSRRKTKDIIYTKILEVIRKSEGKIKIASAAIEVTSLPTK